MMDIPPTLVWLSHNSKLLFTTFSFYRLLYFNTAIELFISAVSGAQAFKEFKMLQIQMAMVGTEMMN